VSQPFAVRFEWAIGELLVLGFLIWELRRLRASQRQDREKAEAERRRAAGETSEP
jgi:hypothetical protein